MKRRKRIAGVHNEAAVKANGRELWGRDICCKRRRYPSMNLKWKPKNGLDLTNKKKGII